MDEKEVNMQCRVVTTEKRTREERNQEALNVWRTVITNSNWTPLGTALNYALQHLEGLTGKSYRVGYSRDGRRTRLSIYVHDKGFWNLEQQTSWMGKQALLRYVQREILRQKGQLNAEGTSHES